MAKGRVSVAMTGADIDKIIAALKGVKALLPFLLVLNAEERKGMLKLGPKRVSFVQNVRNMVLAHPELVPAYIDAPEFILDVSLLESIDKFLPFLAELAEGGGDTRMVAGGEAIATAFRMYEIFKACRQGRGGARRRPRRDGRGLQEEGPQEGQGRLAARGEAHRRTSGDRRSYCDEHGG